VKLPKIVPLGIQGRIHADCKSFRQRHVAFLLFLLSWLGRALYDRRKFCKRNAKVCCCGNTTQLWK